jgi:hypothetical protein
LQWVLALEGWTPEEVVRPLEYMEVVVVSDSLQQAVVAHHCVSSFLMSYLQSTSPQPQ